MLKVFKMPPMARREAIEGYIFLLPWILGFVLFTGGPILASLILSFTRWDLSAGSLPQWVGLDNFSYLLTGEKLFWKSLRVTLTYALGAIPIGIILGLAIALLMNQKVPGVTVFRTIYYLPAVVSGVAVALLWMWVFNDQFGVLNNLLRLVGIQGPNWLQDERWALPAVIIMSFWGVGGGMIIYLAGLQSIPTDLYEAADIDGATRLRKFWNITIPMLSPTLFFNLVMGIIASLQVFTQVYIMTQGGPNYATYFYALHLYYTAFRYLRMGYASALAWVLFLIILALTLLVFKSSSYWVFYAGEKEEGT